MTNADAGTSQAVQAGNSDSEPMIRIDHVFKFFKDVIALRDVSLRVRAGEKVVIIGPSGSGKSTLLRSINRLESVDRGTIVVDGKDVLDPKANINAIRQELGMVFQSFNLFPHKTVLENLILAPMKLRRVPRLEAVEIAMRLLTKVNISDKAMVYPSMLSGGQQQRVAIARAIVTDPDIIVADEPTGDLDRQSAADIMALLGRLNAELGKTIVMVTHDQRAAEAAHLVRELNKGELRAAP